MPEVSGNALAMAIQAVDQKITALKKQIDCMDEDDDALMDLEDLMVSYIKSADELRRAYEEGVKTSGNLPAYDTLVKAS